MFHRPVNVVLAILMLMPAGICTCDGGVVPCLDHPVQNLTHSDAGRANGPAEAAVAAETGWASPAHQCAPPRPHQPSCGVAAPEFLTDSPVSDISTALADIDHAVAVEWPTPKPCRSDPRTPSLRRYASPIYLANCALLI